MRRAAVKQAAEAKEAKALAEKQAPEATEKRLEWTGKAMQRAGFKEEAVKRALTQGGTVVAWGRDVFGQTTVPAGLSGVVAIAAGTYHTVALKLE
jgi:translation initiation factor RLI1